VNTLASVSFNVGPTLADWLEREAADTWAAILEADRVSTLRLRGHGNALAMPYHHVILPLASRRDKETEVRWGITDFRRRFGREPEGMWLPETAVDDETLDVLAAQGIRFTVLAPHQVEGAPPDGRPGLYTTSAGRTIALFAYDGPLSHGVAFGPLISDAAAWTREVLARAPAPGALRVVSIATDGETFGHHHTFGEMALAAVLERMGSTPDTVVENFASFLARHPATQPVQLMAPSSWSCVHGIERWRSDCGCRTREGTSQAWRAPLRTGLDQLATALHRQFEQEAGAWFPDPWAARDSDAAIGLPSDLPVRARELLEMERNALRMFTSCGWFFDDIAGLESLVCLRYAARAIELAGDGAPALEAGLRLHLAEAVSNNSSEGSGRDVYDRRVRPPHPGHVRAAAGFALLRQIAPERVRPVIGAWLVGPGAEGEVLVRHRRTGREFRMPVAVHRERRTAFLIEVTAAPGEPPRRVTAAELPEHERDELRLALRAELRPEVLEPAEERRLAEGTASFDRTLARALVEQLPDDPAGRGPVNLHRLECTLDLMELEGLRIPFDAQTRFHRIRLAATGALRAALDSLAPRLGFAGPGGPDAPSERSGSVR
jgi:hypothetical protein